MTEAPQTSRSDTKLVVSRKASMRVKLVDTLASGVIRMGGIAVIIAVVAIFFFFSDAN